jgi:hypothetical protein
MSPLHWCPKMRMPVFDERAGRAIRLIEPRLRLSVPASGTYDRTYARFVQGCAPFHKELEQLLGRTVTPREVDKVRLAVADRTT